MVIDEKNSVVLKQLRNASKINKNALLKMSIEKHEKFILELNRSQMRSGLDSMAQYIQPDYSVNYLESKLKIDSYKAPVGVPDLFLSGGFQKSLILDIANVQYLIYSVAAVARSLELRYTEKIYGLMPVNLRKAQSKVTPDYNKLYHKELNK
jgi:hypothetical protein